MAGILIQRRELLTGLFGTIIIGTSLPMPVPKATKEVTVLCETVWRNSQWVVFDDKPTYVWRFEIAEWFTPFKRGDKLLVEV